MVFGSNGKPNSKSHLSADLSRVSARQHGKKVVLDSAPQFFPNTIWLQFWDFEVLIWVRSGVMRKTLRIKNRGPQAGMHRAAFFCFGAG